MAIQDAASHADVSDAEMVVARRVAATVAALIAEDNADILTILATFADLAFTANAEA